MSNKSIVKNTALMTIASIGQKIVAFVYFTIIARSVGAEDTGKYFIALSFTTVFVVFVDLGLTNVLVREGSKYKEKIQDYLSTILSIKLFLGIFSYLALILVINLFDYESELKGMIYLSGITMIFDSIHLSLYGILRAIGDLRYEAFSLVISQTLSLILGSAFLFARLPLIFLILAFTIPSFLNVCFASFVLYKKHNIKFNLIWKKELIKNLIKLALPFAIAAVFARVYSYIDSIIMSQIAGETVVGWYSVPYKITYAFQFLPLALVATLYPRFSEFYKNDNNKLQYTFEQSIKYLLLIVLPISIGIFILAKDIIIYLYTIEYVNSILPLKILILSLIFSYLSFPIGAFLNACNKQNTQTVIVGVVLVINVILNLFLIPKFGAIGAAVSALVGNICLTVFGYIFVPKITSISHKFFFNLALKLLFSVTVMGIAVVFVNSKTNFVFAIIAGVFVYPLLVVATKAISMSQMKEAWSLLFDKKEQGAINN